MKEKFVEYLSNIGVSETVVKRVELIHNEMVFLFGVDDFDNILICDINNNGVREFTSLWFFSSSMAYECKNFMNAADYDVTPIGGSVVYFNMVKDQFNFGEEPDSNSQVTINALSINGKITMNFHVTGVNCGYALKIAKEYFLPNIRG